MSLPVNGAAWGEWRTAAPRDAAFPWDAPGFALPGPLSTVSLGQQWGDRRGRATEIRAAHAPPPLWGRGSSRGRASCDRCVRWRASPPGWGSDRAAPTPAGGALGPRVLRPARCVGRARALREPGTLSPGPRVHCGGADTKAGQARGLSPRDTWGALGSNASRSARNKGVSFCHVLSRRLRDSDSAPRRRAQRAGSAGGRHAPAGRTGPDPACGLLKVEFVGAFLTSRVSLKNCNRNLMKRA